MAGHRFVVGGDSQTARNTVYSVLESQGFEIEHTSEWSARAERGSKGASIALGAFAGKSGRHVSLDIVCQTDNQGNTVVTLTQGKTGMSGGLIGMSQAKSLYNDIYQTVGSAFVDAGVLLSGGNI